MSAAKHPYENCPAYAHQGPPDVLLQLDDKVELPCHAATLCVNSRVLRELLESNTAATKIITDAEGGVSRKITYVPLPGDSSVEWVHALHQMYQALRLVLPASWAEAEAAISLGNKYDMPGPANSALTFVRSCYMMTALHSYDALHPSRSKLKAFEWAKAAEQWQHADLMDIMAEKLVADAFIFQKCITAEVRQTGLLSDLLIAKLCKAAGDAKATKAALDNYQGAASAVLASEKATAKVFNRFGICS